MAVAVWAALLLALLTAGGAGGPQPARTGTASPGAVGAEAVPGRYAADGCAADGVLQAATRHESHAERPSPSGQFATLPDASAAPCRLARPAAPPPPAVFRARPGPADRGRAPPAPSGT